MRSLIKVSLFDVTSENDFTLLEENGEYFVNFANRTGTYRSFLKMLFKDDGVSPDLQDGEVRGNFLILMKGLSACWNDELRVEVLADELKRPILPQPGIARSAG